MKPFSHRAPTPTPTPTPTLALALALALAAALSAVAFGCGPRLLDSDSGGDAATGVDSGTDSGPASACMTPLMADVNIPLLPPGADTPQIHADVAWDGSRVWFTFNISAPDGSGNLDTWAGAIHCDGSEALVAFRVATTNGRNFIDPTIAISDDAVLIAWDSDSGLFPDNLDLLFRTFDLSGVPIMAADMQLETTRGGVPITGNIWMNDVTVLPDGTFAVAGVRSDGVELFQAFVQMVDANGALVGEAIDGFLEGTISHTNPAISAGDDGTLYVGWTRTPTGAEDRVVLGSIAPGATSVMPSPPPFATADPNSGGVDYLVAPGAGAPTFAALHAERGADFQVVILDGSDFGGAAASLELGMAGRFDHSPVLAARPDGSGGAVAYYRTIAGAQAELIVQGFGFDGAMFTPGAEVNVPVGSPAFGVYAPAITHVEGNTYFVAWTEGASPDLSLVGRFVTVP